MELKDLNVKPISKAESAQTNGGIWQIAAGIGLLTLVLPIAYYKGYFDGYYGTKGQDTYDEKGQ